MHLPSVVRSWSLAVGGSQHPGSGLVAVGADTGHSEGQIQEVHPACELMETSERHQGHSGWWGAVAGPETLAAKSTAAEVVEAPERTQLAEAQGRPGSGESRLHRSC